MSKTVAVLMGGSSAEREVSLVTGNACAEGLREAGYQVAEIDVGHDVAALVEALTPPPDAVFNALHGRWGEDGCVQGVLELMRIPYTHSGLLASALAMDKPAAKRLFEAAGLTCPEGVVVDAQDLATGDALPRPFVVKPVNEGSSVGVRIVKNGTNLPPVDLDQWPPGTKLMVEKFIAGRELTVAVMGERPLAVTEIRPRQGFYDYEAKYTDGRADHVIPAQIPAEVYDRALEMAVTAHRALGCRGVSRADFRYDDTAKAAGDLYLLEINTQPGMTPLSLVPEQAAYLKIEFPELCAWMVERAACDG
jgi:D-alanine-D-alanine ligase